jgi:Flp pilus assembly protein TadB
MMDDIQTQRQELQGRIGQNTRLLIVLTPILCVVVGLVSLLFGFHFSHVVIILVFVIYILGDSAAQKKRLKMLDGADD